MVSVRKNAEVASTDSAKSERQQSLFAPTANSPRERIVTKRDPLADKLLNTLRSLDVDAITAREALQILYDLKNEVPAL